MAKLFCLIVVILSNIQVAVGYFAKCSEEDGGGYCPYGDTCCPLPIGKGSACIPNVLGSFNGTCCHDYDVNSISNNRQHQQDEDSDNDDDNGQTVLITGCAVGYTCEKEPNNGRKYCQATSEIYDQILRVLPRYKLCYQDIDSNEYQDDLFTMHGLRLNTDGKAILPYYSSHGSITDSGNDQRINDIEFAIINIHGALRNADDLFCSTLAAVERQYRHGRIDSTKNILTIAPRFTASTDPDIYINQIDVSDEVIQWDPNDGGFGGAWRFGANAVWPPYAIDISSYDAMDKLVTKVLSLPNIKHISVLGHSAGGQFVQRWSMLTNVWDNDRMSSVVSNPSNYAYLTDLRKINVPGDEKKQEWGIPNISVCPLYNQWMYGFEGINKDDSSTKGATNTKNTYTVPYIQRTISSLGGNFNTMKNRFAQRLIIYLAGELDHCNSTRAHRNPECNSHGLQGTCSDEIQGTNRMERHLNYYSSLTDIVFNTTTTDVVLNQYHDIVPDAGHDYSLIFTSTVGLRAIFSPHSYIPESSLYYKSHNDVIMKDTKSIVLASTAVATQIIPNRIKQQQRNHESSSNNSPTYRFFLRDVQTFLDKATAKQNEYTTSISNDKIQQKFQP